MTTTWASGTPTIVRQRLEDLYGLARLLIRREKGRPFWQSIQSALERSLSADRCVFVGFEESGGLYRLAAQLRRTGAAETLDLSRSVLRDVVNTQQGVLIERVVDHQQYAHAVSLVGRGVGSVICVPVLIEDKPRAILYADRLQTRPPFLEQDLQFAMAAVDLATAAVELDDLYDKAQELARVHGRIEAAREIQELLLPWPLPQPPWGQVAAENVPAEQMSGDTYDVVFDSSGRLITTVADVSGKGVPAAFLTAVLHSTLRASLDGVEDLRGVVHRANQSLEMRSPSGAFVTMLVCRWSADGSSVEIANAGHHPPLWVKRDGTVDAFPARLGLPLGISGEWDGEVVRRYVDDVVTMLLYSDGVIEARSRDGEEYGSDRLCSVLSRHAGQQAEGILTAIADDVERFCAPGHLADDLTLLVVCTKPSVP